MRRRHSLPLLLVSILSPLNLAAVQAEEKIDFATQIQPIFAAKCAGCHGEKKQAGKLRLDSAE